MVILGFSSHHVLADDFENLNNMAVVNNTLSMSYLTSAFFCCYLDPLPNFVWFDCSKISPHPIMFSESDFVVAGYNQSVYDAINRISLQQFQQVDCIFSLIEDINSKGNEIYPACNYTFSNTTVIQDFLHNDLLLVQDMIAFYNGATSSLAHPTSQSAAQDLAEVQARHAVYPNLLLARPVSPSSGFDPVLSMSALVGSVSAYFWHCTIPPFGNQMIHHVTSSLAATGQSTGSSSFQLEERPHQSIGSDDVTDASRPSNIVLICTFVFIAFIVMVW